MSHIFRLVNPHNKFFCLNNKYHHIHSHTPLLTCNKIRKGCLNFEGGELHENVSSGALGKFTEKSAGDFLKASGNIFLMLYEII